MSHWSDGPSREPFTFAFRGQSRGSSGMEKRKRGGGGLPKHISYLGVSVILGDIKVVECGLVQPAAD